MTIAWLGAPDTTPAIVPSERRAAADLLRDTEDLIRASVDRSDPSAEGRATRAALTVNRARRHVLGEHPKPKGYRS